MDIIIKIVTNKCIYIPFILWSLIQISKVITDLIKNKRFDVRRIVGAGGMPSSHSAVVCSLAALVGRQCGFETAEFAIALVMAGIVMYDAAGVRRAAGKQAKILNDILDTPGMSGIEVSGKLIECLGHTPFQVVVGALIGFIVGAIF